jgi:hypothetical protein
LDLSAWPKGIRVLARKERIVWMVRHIWPLGASTGTLSDVAAADVIRLVSSLIWPAIVVVLALLFREPITSLLRRLKSIETAGFKGAFNEPAEQALDKADAIDAPSANDPATQALIDQTASHPWWAVHQAWRAVRWAAVQATGELPASANTEERVQLLIDQGSAEQDLLQLTRTLRGLYYDMKAEPQLLTGTAAADYVEAASKLAEALRVLAYEGSRYPATHADRGRT